MSDVARAPRAAPGAFEDGVRNACRDYLACVSGDDPGSAADLYADDGVLEDPVGALPIRGRERIRDFYAEKAGGVSLELSGPLIVCGTEAVMVLSATAEIAGARRHLDVVDVLRFDAQGRIASLRAFCSPPVPDA